MILKHLFYGGLSKATFCLISGNPGHEDLSAHQSRWLVTRPGMRGAATIRSASVTKNWLCLSSPFDFLDRAMEFINDDVDIEVEA